MPGSTPVQYDVPSPTPTSSSTPAAQNSGPIVIGSRGPVRAASSANRGDSSSIATVTGSVASPAWNGREPAAHLELEHEQEEHRRRARRTPGTSSGWPP